MKKLSTGKRFRFLVATLPIAFVLTFLNHRPAQTEAAQTQSLDHNGGGIRRELQARLDELRSEYGFPGATVGIAFPDGKTMALATGYSDLEKKEMMKPEDRMLSGSAGKTFVSAVALKLVEKGRFGLDEKIANLLGDESWFGRLPNGNDITLRMLLNHSSGLPEYLGQEGVLEQLDRDPGRTWESGERIKFVLGKASHFKAGKEFRYSDTNYILAGILIEKATDAGYYETLQELTDSLQLERTGPSDQQAMPELVTGYSIRIRELGLYDRCPKVRIAKTEYARVVDEGTYAFNPQLEWTGGGLLTNAKDLARWSQLLYEGEVVGKSSVAEMTETNLGESGSNRYGLGVQIRHSGNWGITYGHSGWMPGYMTEMEYFPEYRTAIAVQVNTDDQKWIHPRFILLETARIVFQHGRQN